MNWQSHFSAFSPRVSSTTNDCATASSSDSSPEQKPLNLGGRRASASVSSAGSGSDVPLSRTHQYKKITKPLLERKRRARINKCLDELKEIMTVALQAEGENVSKLEKADILELTVRHLHKLSQSRRLMVRNPLDDLHKFQAGYSSCAQEAATFLLSNPGVDVRLGQRMLTHLSTTAGPAMAAHLTSPVLPLQGPSGSIRNISPPDCSPPSSSNHCNIVMSHVSTPPVSSTSSTPSSSSVGAAQYQRPHHINPNHSDAQTLLPGPVEVKKELPDPDTSPSPMAMTQGTFTVSIRRHTPEPLGERNQNEKSVPIRPAAIRLNPTKTEPSEPVWRPYTAT